MKLSVVILIAIVGQSLTEDISLDESSTARKPVQLTAQVEPSSSLNRTLVSHAPRQPSTAARVEVTTEMMSEVEVVHEKWKQFEKMLKKFVEEKLKKVLPMLLRMQAEVEMSEECSKSMMDLFLGVRELKAWAFRMLDASSKLPSGILDGTLTDFGDYDQCLDIKKEDSKKNVQFTGHYCSVETKPLLPKMPHRVQFRKAVLDFKNFSRLDSIFSNFSRYANIFYVMNLRLGLCLPSACSAADVQGMANHGVQDWPLKVNVLRCEAKEPYNISSLQIAVMCIIATIVMCIIVGSYLDQASERPDSWGNKYSGLTVDSLKCFSINKNLEKLFKLDEIKENFEALNGLRVLSMAWVVLIHAYGMNHKQSFSRLKNAQDSLNEVTFGTVINGWVVIDSFFVLGAFLVSHSILKNLDKKNGKLNFTRFYLHRIWRLTPPIVGMLLVTFLLPLLGSGPFWEDVIGKQVGNCEKYWWQALIIPINTWTHVDDQCLGHTWYIASDLHLYFIAPLVLIPLYRWPVIGFLVMLFLNLSCMAIVATLTISHDFYPTVLLFTPDETFTKYMIDLVLSRPYAHMGTYCVGLALGYIFLNYGKVNLKPVHQILGWCAAISCNLAVLYGAYEWNRGNLPTKVVDVTYAMFHKTGWALGIAWIIFMCITGRAGLVNRFLSWEFFVPLGRLTYSSYIIHPAVLWVRNGYRRERLYFHHYIIFYEYLATLTLTLCLSITFHLLFEAPYSNLENVWFPKGKKSKEKPIENEMTILPVDRMENENTILPVNRMENENTILPVNRMENELTIEEQ